MNIRKMIAGILIFKEPKKIENYILEETEDEELKPGENNNGKGKAQKRGKRGKSNTNNENNRSNNEKSSGKEVKISKELENNLKYMKKVYSIPVNSDIIIREFNVIIKDKIVEAFAIYIDGMIDKKIVNESILKPLMLLSTYNIKSDGKNIGDYIEDHLLPQTQVKKATTYESVIDEVNFGGCGIFIDGVDTAFIADVKGWEHRNVERPNIELIIKGPQEGFTEVLRINTALIRKIIRNNNLIVEDINIGRKSKTPCNLLYIKDIVNDSLINQVRKRLKSIKVDYIMDSGELEQYLEDNTYLSVPQVIDTERPDKVAMFLTEGKAAILMNGTPIALVVPANLIELIKSPEDAYIRYPYANFLRIIRMLGMFITLLLPGLYIAITNYHHEMIPTELMFAIEASRERVPFPSIIELLILEVSFELIREAGIRVPGPIGPTLGIIGALILGQAAVAANIVSPILIIVVAVTGIGSFAVPSFSFGFGVRISRFFYIILGALSGFLGIATGLFINGIWIAAAKSFGIPFLVPFAPRVSKADSDFILRKVIWKQEWRPDYLNVKKRKSQSHISRGWTKK